MLATAGSCLFGLFRVQRPPRQILVVRQKESDDSFPERRRFLKFSLPLVFYGRKGFPHTDGFPSSYFVADFLQKWISRTRRGWTIRLQWCVSVFRYHKVVSFGGVFSSADAIAGAFGGDWYPHFLHQFISVWYGAR